MAEQQWQNEMQPMARALQGHEVQHLGVHQGGPLPPVVECQVHLNTVLNNAKDIATQGSAETGLIGVRNYENDLCWSNDNVVCN